MQDQASSGIYFNTLPKRSRSFAIWVILFLPCVSFLSAEDWPQFLGPHRDGTCTAEISATWPAEGPARRWERTIGHGFAGPSVVGTNLYLFHRIENRELLECFETEHGKTIWKVDQSTSYRDDFGFDDGPRAVPTIAGDRIYTLGAEGLLTCRSVNDGHEFWNVPSGKKFSAEKGFFGFACSPLVEGNLVIVNIGGKKGAGTVAFNKISGDVVWKATDDEASYSSPIAATFLGHREIVCFSRSGLFFFNPADGSILAHQKWRSTGNASVNSATPLAVGDRVFVSASYETGAALWKRTTAGITNLWSGDEILSNHYATSVYFDGTLYGFHGRQEGGQQLRAVDFQTGKVLWELDGLTAGTVLLANKELLITSEGGEILRLETNRQKAVIKHRSQILPSGIRAYPAIAGSGYYARSKDKLYCFNLGGK